MNLTEGFYKRGAVLPIILIVFTLAVLGMGMFRGQILERDIDLKGGVQIMVNYREPVDTNSFESFLKSELETPDIRVRTNSDPATQRQLGLQIEAGVVDVDLLEAKAGEFLGFTLSDENRSITHFESSLAAGFWKQAQKAILLAVVLMCIIVVIAFKKPILFGAIMLNVFADLGTTIAVMSILNIKLSLAAIAALLMILGYGVDSNILLCTRAIKERGGTRLERINMTLPTGITMTATTMAPLFAIMLLARASELKTIAAILLIGLAADFIYTWLMNVNILLRAK